MKPYEPKLIIIWELSKGEVESIAYSDDIIGYDDTIPDEVFIDFLELERKSLTDLASRMGYENTVVIVAASETSRLQINAYTTKREYDIEDEVREQFNDYIVTWEIFDKHLKQAYEAHNMEV